ncbi:hypothetical protein CHU92_10875 [Flavobacterium cyanobacteriorum]|uniref:DUF4252 domain-containing protein n=1 Tax=Flavobacterium cyanobacteriorum TaxID=2022802 RepID=A0A255Z216_9FLAO|nr:DUF4252 domain-containing protein [Flavobacterium cyanobacteriorum]OYQ35471.1 hypothetical protein CHU92_10875 [Flavobacterium cyanobacteriorum]
MIRTLFVAIVLVATLLFVSCDNKPTLQKYYVEHSGKPNYSTVDIAPTFINTKKLKLSAEEKKALQSLKKFNVLIYQKKNAKAGEYEQEKEKVKSLIRKDNYEELIKFSGGGMGASISTKGQGQNIDEFVVFLNNAQTGFGIVRVLGEDMTPNNIMTIAGLIQKAGIDKEQLKPLQQLIAPQPEGSKDVIKVQENK